MDKCYQLEQKVHKLLPNLYKFEHKIVTLMKEKQNVNIFFGVQINALTNIFFILFVASSCLIYTDQKK